MWCGQDIFFGCELIFFTVVLTMGCQHCWANGFFGSLSFLLTNKYACLLALVFVAIAILAKFRESLYEQFLKLRQNGLLFCGHCVEQLCMSIAARSKWKQKKSASCIHMFILEHTFTIKTSKIGAHCEIRRKLPHKNFLLVCNLYSPW